MKDDGLQMMDAKYVSYFRAVARANKPTRMHKCRQVSPPAQTPVAILFSCFWAVARANKPACKHKGHQVGPPTQTPQLSAAPSSTSTAAAAIGFATFLW